MRNFLPFGFVLLFIFWGFDGVGQRKCGTESPTFEQTQIMLKSIIDFEKNILPNRKQSRTQSISVPIKFHALYDGYGNGGSLNSSINNIITTLNFWYANSGISFYALGEVNSIINYNYYYCNLEDSIDDRKSMMDTYSYTNAFNIFFIGRFITTNPNKNVDSTTGIAYLPLPTTYKTTDDVTNIYSEKGSNGIFVLSNFSNVGNVNYQVEKTIPHEVGHYWGLLHTFENCSCTGGQEYVNGINGSISGDLVQDTPADNEKLVPYLRKNILGNCYLASNTERDPNNQQYSPQLNNIMSYYDGCGGLITGGQFTRTYWGQYVRNRLNTNLSQRYYLDGLRRILISPTTYNRLYCGGSTISFDYGIYGEPSFVNATSSVRLYNSIGGYYDLGTLTTGQNFKTVIIPTNITAGYYDLKIYNSYTSPDVSSTITLYINGTTNGTPTGSPIASQYFLATTTLYNATSTCAGNSISLYGSISGYDSYWWTKNGQNYTASSTDSYFNASSTGNYTLNMMKCGNVYRSSNSIYLNFYNTTTPSITASSNGLSTNFRLATCEGSPVTLSTGCQSDMNPLWSDGSTSSIRYINASSTRDFVVNCNNYFCKTNYSPPVRITALNPNVQSTKTGNWQDVTLWTSNIVPLNCQTVTIQAGHTVNVPINDAKAKYIIIKGNLNFQNVSPTVTGKVGLGI